MNIRTAPVHLHDAEFEARPDGTLLVRNPEPLQANPHRVTERLERFAARTPACPFLASRSGEGWRKVSYAETFEAARSIGQGLLDRGLSIDRPVLILSGNSIEHALLSLACLHVGVPFVPISPAYSLISGDFARLRGIVELVRPGLVFADDGDPYAAALHAVIPQKVELVIAHGNPRRTATPFVALVATTATHAVDSAAAAIRPEACAKLLFTSGSTGDPKGVIRTQGTECSAMAMILQSYPAFATEPPVLVDWLPWNHIWGGSVSFGIALFTGGTLYIDDGRPLPGRVEETVRNLSEVAPLLYSSVPKGYEELLPWLHRDRTLRLNFFSRVRILQYSGASLAQWVRDEVDQLAVETAGERIRWVPMLGSTEAGLMTLCREAEIGRRGGLGMPGPNVTLKLVPNDGQMEVRVRSPCVTPGYWRRPDLTAAAFDEDGFLKTGDALDWMDASDRGSGFRYRGRIAEDFKLATGTWVRVGLLRSVLLQHLAPEVRDVVIAGESRSYVAVLAIPATNEAVADIGLQERVRAKLKALAQQNGGSAQRVMRLAFLTQPLSIDAGEVTDKGGLNQRSILRRHSALVEQLYAETPGAHVICAD